MNSKSVAIALAQVPVHTDKAVNLALAEDYIAKAAAKGADLVAFPEMFMACPQKGVPLAHVAEAVDGPFISTLAKLARQHQITIVCGVWEQVPDDDQRAANVLIALDANGDLVARYNKIHLFDALSVKESEQMLGGDCPPPQFKIKGITIGLAICYDLRFPELFRYHAQQGADLVLLAAAWYAGPLKEDHWLTLLRARAIENTSYVAGVDLCGKAFSGRSSCFDPFGVPVCDAGEGERLVIAHIDAERVRAVRSKLPCLEHRRNDLF